MSKKSVLTLMAGWLAATCIFAMCFLMEGCNVGLGESVDTEAPTVAISYPPMGAVIRDKFVFAGSWSDDKGVTSVKVDVIDTSTKKTIKTTNASVSDNAWQVEIDSSEINDGTYQFTATAYDDAGHKTDTSRSFDIDNTAPVFVITSPGVTKSDTDTSATAYGTTFNVEGRIGEQHEVSKITMHVYKCNDDGSVGDLLSSEDLNGDTNNFFTESDISTAGGTSVTFANSNDESDKRYSLIYTLDKGTENFYCDLTLYDSAKIYADPSEAENLTEGNSTSSLYLYDDVYQSLMSTKNDGKGLSVTNFMQILNGTESNDSVLQQLKSFAKDTSDSSYDNLLKFSLNPNANPTYAINGYEVKDLAEVDSSAENPFEQAGNGNSVSVTISAGLDGTRIQPYGQAKTDTSSALPSLKIWAKQFSSIDLLKAGAASAYSGLENAVKTREQNEEDFVVATTADADKTTLDDGWILIYDYAQDSSVQKSSSVEQKTFAFKLPDIIESGTYYLVGVTGCDIDGVYYSQDTTFVFQGTTAGVAPTIAITSPAAMALEKSSDALVFEGTAVVESDYLYISELIASLKVTDQSTGKAVGTYYTKAENDTIETENRNQTYAEILSCNGRGGTLTSESGDGAFVISGGNWTFTPSKLSNYSEIQAAENGDKSYLYTLTIYAKSSSGHDVTMTSNVQVDSVLPTVTVSSITPTVSGSSFDNSDKTYVNGTVYVSGTVRETNLSGVTMQILVNDEVAETKDLGVVYEFSESIDTTKLADLGSLDIKIIATDSVGNVGESNLSASETYSKLYVNQETDKPRITLNNASTTTTAKDENGNEKTVSFLVDGGSADNINADNGNLFGVISNNRISATIEDDDIVKNVVVNLYKADGTTLVSGYPLTKDISKSTYGLSLELPSDEGVYVLEISATDDVLSTALSKSRTPITTSTGKFYIAVSAGAPTINLGSIGTYLTSQPTFTGTVSSKEATVTAQLSYTEDGEAKTKDLTVSLAKDSEGNVIANEAGAVNWTAKLADSETLGNNTYQITFTAANNYKEKNATTATFMVDSESPAITVTEYNSVANENGYTNETFYVNPEYTKTVKGNATDGVSGVDAVYFMIGNIPEGKETPSTANGWSVASVAKSSDNKSATWTASLTELSSLEENTYYTMHIKAVDAAGNSSGDNTAIKIVVDKTKPTTTLDVKSSDVALSKITDGSYITKSQFTLSGTITEASLDTLKINGNAVEVSENAWTYTSSDTADGTYTYNIILTDKAGNQSSTSATVIYDTTAPNLTVTSPIGSSNTKDDGSFTIEGSASDNGSGMKSVSYTVYKAGDIESGSPKTDATAASAGSVGVTSSGAWTIPVPGEGKALSEEGQYVLFVTASDQIGNTKAADSVSFYYDKSAPTLAEETISDESIGTVTEGEGANAKTYTVYPSSSLNIKVKATDAVSGVANVVANGTTSLTKSTDENEKDYYTGKVIATLDAEGKTSIEISATDKAGLSSKTTIENIMVDIDPPKVEITTKPTTAQNKAFTLGGTVSDNVEVASVTVTDSLDSTKTYTATVTNGTWTLTLTPTANGGGDNETKDGSHTYTVKATDKAGLSTTTMCQFTTDVTKPEWATTQKDSTSGATEPYVNATGKNVVVSTSSGTETHTYYNTTSLTIAAKANDVTSGVEGLYYNLNEAKDDAGKQTWTRADNANFALGNFKEGLNTIIVKAIDAAGNESTQTTLSFYVDSLAPTEPKLTKLDSETDSTKLSEYTGGSKLVNGTKAITFTLDVADNTEQDSTTYSGIDSVKITKIGSNTLKDAIIGTVVPTSSTTTDGTTTYSLTIPSTSLATGAVNVTVTDKAGNSAEFPVFNLLLDNKAPTLVLNSPADADSSTTEKIDVNQIISLSGTASDNQKLNESSIYLEYTTTEPAEGTKWTKLDTSNAGENYAVSVGASFTASGLDTKKFTNNSTIYVRAAASDAAENEGHSDYITLYVNQDSDRPVINITSLDKSGSDVIISSQSVIGTISDDDGVSKFEYSSDAGSTWTDITVSSGSWKIENLAAGEHSLTFRVTDAQNGVFTTGDTTGTEPIIKRPYISYAKVDKADNTSATQFAVDLAAPTINGLYIATTSDNVAPSATETDGKLSAEWIESGKGIASFGASSKYMSILISAKEDVRVHTDAKDDVSVKVGSVEVVVVSTSSTTTTTDATAAISRTPTGSVNGDLVYVIGPVDITTIQKAEGTVTVSVTVKDASGRESGATQNIYVDAGAPEVSITSPNAEVVSTSTSTETKKTNGVSTTTEAITGKYTIKGRVADTSGIAKFKYLIPTNEQIKTISSTTDFTGWTSVKSVGNGTESGSVIEDYTDKLSSSQWAITFDSSSFDVPTDAASLIYYATAKTGDSLTYATVKDSTTGEVYVPLYFYVEDATGNGEIVENKILVNPKGGIPTIEIITPENLAKTGGNLNFQGTASDDEKVDKVVLTKLQFSATEATDQTSADAISDWKNVTADILKADGVVTKAHSDSSGTIDGIGEDGTITADGTNSWKIAINTSKITNAQLSGLGITELKTVRATIVSYDENGTPSNYDVSTFKASDISSDSGETTTSYVRRTVFVDKNAPKLVTTQLVQFADGTTVSADATPSVIRTYSAGMYISHNTGNGNWYLKGIVTDDASVTGISITTTTGSGYISLDGTVGSDSATASLGSESGTSNGIIYSGLGTKTFTFLIPLTTTSEGQFYPTIEMWDGQHTDVTSNVSFFVDNDAPSLYTTKNESTATLAHADTLRLTSNGLIVSTTNVVENSDGAYSFGDTAVEERSGLDFIAVYFKKAASETFKTANRVYSPLFNTNNVVTLTEVSTGSTATDGEVYINSEGLPALVKNVTRSDATHISYSGLGSNGFIKPYTVVKMAGSYIRITGIDGDVATLASEVDTNVTECEFIYAQIVDHAVSEGFSSTEATGVSNDDGDGFVETLKQTGSSYKWSASVYSDNIPDGPAEIHVVAFDAAGNYNAGYVKTSIANNRPRISKVLLATDLNGNGKFDFYNSNESMLNDLSDDDTVQNGSQFGEFVFYSTLKVSDSDAKGVAQSKVTLNAPKVFNVKKDLLVLPEFVGGNGALKYAYSLDNTTALDSYVTGSDGSLYSLKNTVDDLQLADKTLTDGTETIQKVASLVQSTPVSDSDTSLKYGGVVLTMNATTHKDLDDGKERYLAFTFWDNTSETTQGTDSLWATVNIPAYIDVVDNKVPESTITPFWWESADDYKSSFVYDSDGNAQGHISNITDDDRAKGTKPGVSGKVYINGSSYDETRLGEIHVVKPDTNATDEKIIWRALKDGSSTEYEWKTADGAEIISEEEPSQDGHTITWRYQIDMTSYGVATDKVVKTYAVDAQTNKETVAEKQTTTKEKTPYYKMDFVPYIKSIYTTTIGSANRSRLGKFPVRAGEKMTIEGMNFASGATYKVYFYKSDSDSTSGISTTAASTVDGTYVSDGKITVAKAPDYSRWVSVGVTPADGSEVMTPNNGTTDVSEILGCDIESGYVSGSYNIKIDGATKRFDDKGYAKANNAGTNFWTGNRYIAVWNVPSTSLFAGSINPHSGVIKKISEKNSGSLTGNNVSTATTGSSSNSDTVGGGYFYSQNGTNSALKLSSSQYDRYFGALSSDDIKVYGYLGSEKSSNSIAWNNVITSASEAMGYAPGIDEMDYTTVNGLPYYVMQDNYLGGDSASVWGPGLFLTREGMSFNKEKFQGSNTIEEEQCYFIIERQGDSGAAAKRNSTTAATGYDRVLYQFKNPRIAGVQVSSEKMNYSNDGGTYSITGVDYIYVSYYDSYARCLKYAGYKVGHRIYKDSLIDMYQWGNNNYKTDIVPMMHSAPNSAESNNHSSTSDGITVSATNHMADGATTVAGYDTTISNPTKFPEEAGEWSDIMVDSTGEKPIPVIIYYNKSEKRLEIARGTVSFPSNNRLKTSSTTTGSDTEWKKTNIKPNGTSDFGRYVSAVMDEAGNIHAAAVDAGKGKVWYLYLTKSSDTYSVASSSIIGDVNACWTDIELTSGEISSQAKTVVTTTTDNEGKVKVTTTSGVGTKTLTKDVKPVISWVDKSELNATDGVKVSYLADDDTDGTKWETMTDPAVYAVNDQRTSVMANVYEGSGDEKAKIGVGFNSDMLALDFLRGEE